MNLPEGYRIEKVQPNQGLVVAVQRGQMFVDMGTMTEQEAAESHGLWGHWLRDAIDREEYIGLFVINDHDSGTEIPLTVIVGGVGILLQPRLPSLKDPALHKAYILNMYVEPSHRRKGLAEALMQAALAEARARGIRNLNLNAAPLGRHIYERLGFVEATNPEMRLTLGDEP